MESILRAVVVYAFMWLVFRLSGKRSLAQITTFDFVLLLIISETTQGALTAQDDSLTNATLLIATLIAVDVFVSWLELRSKKIDAIANGTPLVIVKDGKPLYDRMRKERVQVSDVLTAARRLHGVRSLNQIEYAVLEREGHISIIPRGV